MILLDTNVLSELMRGGGADPHVLAWVRGLTEQPVTTVLNRAEIAVGLALMPPGRRQVDLVAGLHEILSDLATALPFTEECVPAFVGVVVARTRSGRPIGTMDALIASVALVHGAAVATRDIGGFTGLGLEVVDPWTPRTRH